MTIQQRQHLPVATDLIQDSGNRACKFVLFIFRKLLFIPHEPSYFFHVVQNLMFSSSLFNAIMT